MKHTDKDFIERCVKAHMAVFERWPYGPVETAWTDKDGNLCIRYAESPSYWHYIETKNGQIEWW